MDRRRRDAANILIEEISAGAHESADFLPDEIDPFIEICHRFSKAVEDGTARSNLKLLAQVIAGQKRNKALDPDGFRKWASVLSDLTRTELILVGTVIRVSAIHSRDVWNEVRKEMKDARFEPLEIEALGAAITRTGLLSPAPAWGAINYKPTQLLEELSTFVKVEDLIK